jgi:hypothetical protein
MSAVAAAIVGSAVVGAGTAYLVSESQKDAAKKASKAQTTVARENLQLQKELADTQRHDFEPWRESGQKALTQLQAGIDSGEFTMESFDPSKISIDPGFDFRLSQGVEALDRSAAARGKLQSGAQQRAVAQFGQELGSQEYGNAYARAMNNYQTEANRRLNKFNILAGLSGQGQASAAQQAGATGQLAANSGNILQNLGNAQAQSQYAQGQAQANMYGNIGQTANQAAQNWLLYNTLQPQSGAVKLGGM